MAVPGSSGRSRGIGPRTWHWIAFGVFVALIVLVVLLAVLSATGTLRTSTVGGGLSAVTAVFLALGALLAVTILSILMLRWGWPWEEWRSSARFAGQVRWGRPGLEDPAVIAARERYARGEITREEYDEILTDLARRGRGPGGPLSGA
jgi:uncharacterized membrane protein